jgi:hypothetical protein
MMHTAEPWATAYRATGNEDDMAQEIFDTDGRTIATLAWYRVRKDERTTGTNREENARRIVACVNACKGVTTEALQAMVEITISREPINELFSGIESQRNELLAALKFYAEPENYQSPSHGFALQYDPEPPKMDGGALARAAISKIEAANGK